MSEEAQDQFTLWLQREMPPGTVIGSPTWWAPRIWRAVENAQRTANQPNGATGWIDNAVTPPGESVERVLVAYPTGLVETTQAHYVRLYPTNYPWWMPLPVAPVTVTDAQP